MYAEDLIQASQHSKHPADDVKPIVSKCNDADRVGYSKDCKAALCDDKSSLEQAANQDVYDNLTNFSEIDTKKEFTSNVAKNQTETKPSKETNRPTKGKVYLSKNKTPTRQQQKAPTTQDEPPPKYATTPRSNRQSRHKSSLSSLPPPSPTTPSPSSHPSTQPFIFPPQLSSSSHSQQNFKVFPALVRVFYYSICLDGVVGDKLKMKCIRYK